MNTKMYSITEIAEEFKMGIATVYERIRLLEIHPCAMIGKVRMYNDQKKNCIGAYVKYEPIEVYQIFESKMNFNREL